MTANTSGRTDRWISLAAGLPELPERLLLAHGREEVLFVAGSGVSMPGLPDFKGLVLRVYERLDTPVHAMLRSLESNLGIAAENNASSLSSEQLAEVGRFKKREYDVVLGMLERRMDGPATPTSKVRRTIEEILREGAAGPKPIHTALIRLADRRAALTIVTTNFDLLLEAAARKHGKKTVKTYALGGIPRPGRSDSFEGVLHIHGALSARNAYEASNLIVTDQDFGESYLRRRVVPDFIYDAARLFHLVLVGYSANDPPMRYLLNAVAADGSRFDDLKERFAFVGMSSPPDPVSIADWKGRGITPIPYLDADNHAALTGTLKRWSELSAVNGKRERVDAELKRITRGPRSAAAQIDQDLFDHLIRRSASTERVRISAFLSNAGSPIDWLDALLVICRDPRREVL